MELALNQMLEKLVQSPCLQAGFLEALSELENCGAKKIMGYETRTNTDLTLLQHAAEETRHAYFFKKLAYKQGARATFTWLDRKSRRYLDRLELFIARCLHEYCPTKRKEACYVLTTYYIEERATWLYTHYEATLRTLQSDFSLQSVLREEMGHLADIERKKDSLEIPIELQTRMQDFEATLWEEWMTQLQDKLHAHTQYVDTTFDH